VNKTLIIFILSFACVTLIIITAMMLTMDDETVVTVTPSPSPSATVPETVLYIDAHKQELSDVLTTCEEIVDSQADNFEPGEFANQIGDVVNVLEPIGDEYFAMTMTGLQVEYDFGTWLAMEAQLINELTLVIDGKVTPKQVLVTYNECLRLEKAVYGYFEGDYGI
jgi:hypothetical protein